MYYLADANFNVTALVNTSGTVVERYLYTPYGEVTVLDSDFSSDADGKSDYSNTTLYTGRTFDPAIGLYYYRHRVYHPRLGRFVSRDPVGYIDSMNLAGYVENSPCSGLDPSGMIYLGLPATPEKCAKAVFVMKYYATLLSFGTYDNLLLDHYLASTGANLDLSMGAFDPWGAARQDLYKIIKGKVIQKTKSLACGRIVAGGGIESGQYKSGTLMINQYGMKASYFFEAKKKCCGPLEYTTGRLRVQYKAYDTTDFNPGDAFGALGLYIADSLIIECNIGKPFDIGAVSTKDESFSSISF